MVNLLKQTGVLAATVGVALSCSSARLDHAGSVAKGLSATSVTQAGDELRSSWYSDEANLSPSIVGGTSFGQLFSTAIDGQVYAQPLVWNGTLLVATETNHVYGIDAISGAIDWTQSLGTPFAASDVACGDLTPSIGITGTPVIDQSSGVAYMFSKTYSSTDGGTSTPAWYAHALDVASGAEQPGFPVLIAGTASNDSSHVFTAKTQHQRPGLLLLNGVVYAAFGGHCDVKPYGGWIVGVSTAGAITTLWSTQAGPTRTDGAAIWQSGSGLTSDGPGQIIFATANGGAPSGSSIPGTSPPSILGESVVRVAVQSDGSLHATDFFAPSNATTLDQNDNDLSASGPVGLPSSPFGTVQHPHLMFTAGKEGYVYLLDRDNLGGFSNGAGGTDNVLQRLGPYGGFWSKAAVWPGDGGYIYMPAFNALSVFAYGLDGSGNPSLTRSTFVNGFGFGSGSPVVTSNGTQSGSALVWVIYEGDSGGSGGQLRAYDAVPVNGALPLRFSAAIGTANKFTPPGVSGGRVYVGTRDGHVVGFGSTAAALTGSGYDFGNVIVGHSSATTLTLTANGAVSVTSVASSSTDFSVGATTPGLPASLQAGSTLQIPVTFTPSTTGARTATIVATTPQSSFTFPLSGKGLSPSPLLAAAPTSLTFGTVAVGSQQVTTVQFSNAGGASLTINAVDAPLAPFSISGAPAVGSTLASGASVNVTVTFAPTANGSFGSSFGLETSAGTLSVPLSGSGAPPGLLVISPASLSYGDVGLGGFKYASFTLSNTGGTSINITKSKPPALGLFVAQTALAEGTTIAAGAQLTETVELTPSQVGSASDSWIITADDGNGVHTVSLTSTTNEVDLTSNGSIIALVTTPTGSGNKNAEVIRDGVYPPVGSTDSSLEYDTNNGGTRTEDWIGYQFPSPQTFGSVVFEDGMQFSDGGWFTNIKVQVRQSGIWMDVPGVTISPAYAGNDGVNYETYTFTFPPITGDAIRIDGAPGGSATYFSVGELRVLAPAAAGGTPTAYAGGNQSALSGEPLTLDGSHSSDPNGGALTYSWTQTAGPLVALSSSAASQPTFTAPTVSSLTTLTFSLVVQNASVASAPSSVTVTVTPSQSITLGQSKVGPVNDSGNGNLLIAEQATLSEAATLVSMSFYVRTTGGSLRMGVYDATGAGGGPGEKIAETTEITPTATGWNSANVTSPVSLAAGTYWLAFNSSSDSLGSQNTGNGGGPSQYYALTYGPLPSTFASGATTDTVQWSVYATLLVVTNSNPPTVATPASATLDSTDKTASLTVLGADGGGEASLTYTWATSGTPPAPVSFSINGTNAAKNTVATFSKAGTYSLQATIADPQGNSTSSAVSVTVAQVQTTVSVAPATTSVSPNATAQFAATANDQFGAALATQPAFSWSVSGGGTISSTGLFTAGASAGGPFSVVATSGSQSGGASVTVVAASTSIVIGQSKVGPVNDSGNGNLLIAEQATLSQTVTVQSMSFYVTKAAGALRMGIYDATGAGGGPGNKLAETSEITTTKTGWNTANIASPVSLAVGTYWLAFNSSSNNLGSRNTGNGGGPSQYYPLTYGPLPSTFASGATTDTVQWSVYATLK